MLPTPSMRGSDIKQAVGAGRAPAGEFLVAEAGGGEAAFEVDLMPFLATTYDEALALRDASRPILQPMLEAAGLHLPSSSLTLRAACSSTRRYGR